jgi:hypothetical protein
MCRRLCVLGLLALGLTYPGVAQNKRGYTQRRCSYSDYNNIEYATCYDDNDLVDTHSWEPDESEPPLSRAEALKKGRTFLARFVANSRVWKVEEINLFRVGRQAKWVYEIEFECPREVCAGDIAPTFTVVMKMNGRAIEPTASAKNAAPNNGMHPTADTTALKFLQSCGTARDAQR